MKCNPLSKILEIAKDKEVPRQMVINNLEALVKELREMAEKLLNERTCETPFKTAYGVNRFFYTEKDSTKYDLIRELLGDDTK
jgi:hypothetical protein